MPVVRVPVIHKFGIVSVSRAEQLLREGREDGRGSKKKHARSTKASAPIKISQSFITKYNSTAEAERGKLDNILHRMISQAKYKAGLYKERKSGAASSHLSSSTSPSHRQSLFSCEAGGEGRVCDAWIEFILLCQCYGPHQEDVLLALAMSLNHAPLSSVHIPSLLYMCGLCYQWLKSDLSVNSVSGQLRTGELMLLRILYLISLRLFYHHMVETLQDICTREDVRQLKCDLEGFESRERVYRNFPEALLHWKVALEVGQVVVEKYSPALRDSSLADTTGMPSTIHESSTHEGAGSGGGRREEGHRVSPVLWHSLDLWQVVRGMGHRKENDAIADLLACSTQFNIGNWIESLLAINVLCLGSQLSLPVLFLLHSLANGTTSLFLHPSPSSTHHHQYHAPQINAPLSLGTDSHSASLFRETPTVTSQNSEGTTGKTSSKKHHFGSLSPKKGTRFKLPGSELDTLSFSGDHPTGSVSSKRRPQVDTLNVLGIQPGFREPYPEAVYTDGQTIAYAENDDESSDNHYHHLHVHSDVPLVTKSHTTVNELEGIVGQSLGDIRFTVPTIVNSSHESSKSQKVSEKEEMNSQSTLCDLSPPQSIMITSSPWLKSSTSKNLDLSTDDHGESVFEGVRRISGMDSNAELNESLPGTWKSGNVPGTPIEEKLEALQSPLGESITQVELLDKQHQSQGYNVPSLGASGGNVTLFGRNVETRCTHYTHSSSALSGGAGVPGSHIAPSTVYRHSVYSPLTIDVENEESGGLSSRETVSHATFENWPSEVALAYTLNMSDVVIYGRTSQIQSTALEGMSSREKGVGGLGLKQLAGFSHTKHSSSEKSDFMAWTIRHGAVLGLSRVCHTCKQLPMKDGLSTVAWSTLVSSHSTEKDARVLEAFKMSQVCPDVDGPLLATDEDSLSSPLLAHMADSLAKVFLPPVTSTSTISSKMPAKRLRPRAVNTNLSQQATAKVDTHHRKGGRPHRPDFTARTLTALHGIVELDWKREMEKERQQLESSSQQQENPDRNYSTNSM